MEPHPREAIERFQARLDDRLRGAREARSTARLGIQVGRQRWLVDLSESGEIGPVPGTLASVPLTRTWFWGLINMRGHLFGVVDWADFAGLGVTPVDKDVRLLSLGPGLRLNVALLVSRVLGLHDVSTWSHGGVPPNAPAWQRGVRVDGEGHEWIELSLSALAADPALLRIVRGVDE